MSKTMGWLHNFHEAAAAANPNQYNWIVEQSQVHASFRLPAALYVRERDSPTTTVALNL